MLHVRCSDMPSPSNKKTKLKPGKRKYDPEHIKHGFICNKAMVCTAHNEFYAVNYWLPRE